MSNTSRAKRAGERVALPQATAYERWELPTVEPDRPVTVDQLASVQDSAFREAYAAGQEKGYADGFQRGREAGEHSLREAVGRFHDLAQTLAEPVKCLDDEVEQALVTLAMAVARQLVYSELHHDPGRVLDVVRHAVAALPLTSRDVRIYLHPLDASAVREAMPLEPGERTWSLVEDPSLERGGCRVEAASSRIDASVRARLMTVISQVLGGEPLASVEGEEPPASSTERAMHRIKKIFDADE